MEHLAEKARKVIDQVNRYILGKEKEVQEVMTAFLANGHVLLEDIPGVGKTTMALAFSGSMGIACRRVQFTPDVMPSDLTGFSVYRKEEERFVYQPGSVFCNLLLADEINRASPKTQSALLEVMEERKVSVEGTTREVPLPFLVIATQNPFGSAGTNYLPEAQIDRFMVSLNLGYPDFENELKMAKAIGAREKFSDLQPVVAAELVLQMQDAAQEVFVSDEIYRYILRLVTATREHPYLEQGASPRATIALVKLSRVSAWMQERAFVIPNDVEEQFPYVAAHRIVPNTAARMEKISVGKIVEEILHSVPKPEMGKR